MIPFFLALTALLSSWVTVLPLNAVDSITAISASPQIMFNVGILLALSALIWTVDWRLGLFVGYVTINGLRAPHMGRPWTSVAFIAFGALAFVMLRERPPRWIKDLLIWSGVLQIAVAALQIYWFDFIWGQSREAFAMGNVVLGTLGQQTMFGAFVAIIGAMAPWKLIPIFVFGVFLSGSRLAWLALGVALIVRLWPERDRP